MFVCCHSQDTASYPHLSGGLKTETCLQPGRHTMTVRNDKWQEAGEFAFSDAGFGTMQER